MKISLRLAALVALVLASGCDKKQPIEVTEAAVENFSVYVSMPDGVKLAVDVWLPEDAAAIGKMPTAIEFTRYWRAMEVQPPVDNITGDIRQTLDHGFAYVAVDVRGTGASFGTREAEFSLAEARDMPHVADWIAKQAWSNGKVVTLGTSYPGNTTEMAALYPSPALVAAIPRFTDYDWYTSIVIPGGLKNAFITERWGDGVKMLDLNDASVFGGHEGEVTAENPKFIGVKPVDSDPDHVQLAEASVAHKENRSLADNLGDLIYRDEYPSAFGLNDGAGLGISIHNFRAEFEQSAVPMYQWGSWFDAGTAAGILARFTRFDAPYQYVIGPWSHGAGFDANPFNEKDEPVEPSADEQFDRVFEFARTYMQNDAALPKKQLRYFTVGEDVWKTTETWPPIGHTFSRMWLGADAALVGDASTSVDGSDYYEVDFTAGTGSSSRWATQLGGGDVWYGDRTSADRLLLTYTSAPLDEDLELTGTAIVSLQLSSTHDDGAVIVYLEDVDENGYVRLLTEGELRLLHRKSGDTLDPVFGPPRSFKKEDGRKMVPGEINRVDIGLLPMSAVIKKGHSIRIAIAGHDADTFLRIPAAGDPTITIYRNAENASYIDLPVIREQP